jgi:hypothetical protein
MNPTEEQPSKKIYQKPALRVYGPIQMLTGSTSKNMGTDAGHPGNKSS